MGDHGIKVSEEGYDVKTADNINLSMKLDLTMLKVALSGSVDLAGDQTIAHNLGYVPQFLVYVWNGTKCYMATGHVSYALARADENNLYIYDNGTSAKYYVLYEQA